MHLLKRMRTISQRTEDLSRFPLCKRLVKSLEVQAKLFEDSMSDFHASDWVSIHADSCHGFNVKEQNTTAHHNRWEKLQDPAQSKATIFG